VKVLLGPLTLSLFVLTIACVASAEVVALVRGDRGSTLRRSLDLTGLALFGVCCVLFVLRLREFS
jgi:hypothetical protein